MEEGALLEVPVFRVALLGLADSGKTCLCTQVVTHNPIIVYEHTKKTRVYRADFNVGVMFHLQPVLITSKANRIPLAQKALEKTKNNPQKRAKMLIKYGVQLDDTPVRG